MKYYYKIVTENIESCLLCKADNEFFKNVKKNFKSVELFNIKYKINEFVKSKSKKYGLCIFNNKKNAKHFIKNNLTNEYKFKLFKCICNGIRKPNVLRVYSWLGFGLDTTDEWPEGTLMADE